ELFVFNSDYLRSGQHGIWIVVGSQELDDAEEVDNLNAEMTADVEVHLPDGEGVSAEIFLVEKKKGYRLDPGFANPFDQIIVVRLNLAVLKDPGITEALIVQREINDQRVHFIKDLEVVQRKEAISRAIRATRIIENGILGRGN
ncbi:MAG: hypothetical protein H0S80_12185, partial [Desulfovibrionaceae bacterium]|nr:hypothetical protein [Desulfovibrionaceae bacterium]